MKGFGRIRHKKKITNVFDYIKICEPSYVKNIKLKYINLRKILVTKLTKLDILKLSKAQIYHSKNAKIPIEKWHEQTTHRTREANVHKYMT